MGQVIEIKHGNTVEIQIFYNLKSFLLLTAVSPWGSSRGGPSRLTGHSAVVYRDSMLVFGGGESQSAPQSSLWCYSFSSHNWAQVAALPGSAPPERIHHCCAGLGQGYSSASSSSSSNSGFSPLQDSRWRPFNNKCFPAPLTFLGSTVSMAPKEQQEQQEAIELETFRSRADSEVSWGRGGAREIISCLTFENKAFRTQSTDEEEEEEEQEVKEGEDVRQNIPDLLLVLGGRPCSHPGPIAVWQMTLSHC